MIRFVNGKREFGIAFAINQTAWKIQRDVKIVAAEQSHTCTTLCMLDAKKERAFKRGFVAELHSKMGFAHMLRVKLRAGRGPKTHET